MKPELNQLLSRAKGVEPGVALEYLERLDSAYFARFSLDEVAARLQAMAKLSIANPVETLVATGADGRVTLDVIATDHPGVFSLICGVLAARGFNILSGETFTYHRVTAARKHSMSRRRLSASPRRSGASAPARGRRRIIDHFEGKLDADISLAIWGEEIRETFQDIFSRLDDGRRDEARAKVNEMVTAYLASLPPSNYSTLYPVELALDNDALKHTSLRVTSQDTPAFLYSLTNALALQGMCVEHTRIETRGALIEDRIDFTDARGEKLTRQEDLDRLKFIALLTKRFTYFLDHAPDPFKALSRFETVVADSFGSGEKDWLDSLTDPTVTRRLARLLGASDFLWEDFIRTRYESLTPILRDRKDALFSDSIDTIGDRLAEALASAESYDDKRIALNVFKDRELYLLDLNHILIPDYDFRHFAESLTRLAEEIVNAAAQLAYDRLTLRHGQPKTVALMPAAHAIFGLGKLGGAALGYASDIELLFIYGDNGETDGDESIKNVEFFSQMVKETRRLIETKREGIFNLDLRLRPHGNNGPLAVSLEGFCRYYGPGNRQAMSYELMALTRLRAIGGDPVLCRQVERLRDEFVYQSYSVDLDEFRELRAKQSHEKNQPGRFNAKFSPGALVDVEYTTQILQMLTGADHPEIRSPRLHVALDGLRHSGALSEEERQRLTAAYDFLRRLINGLRVLRGNAKDLFLPDEDSLEFLRLARRMGYLRQGELDVGQQLRSDFLAHTAAVRAFVEKRLGGELLEAFQSAGNVVDVLLVDELDAERAAAILSRTGFHDTLLARRNLLNIAGFGRRRDVFVKLAPLACDTLRREPDPDMALNNWERFVQVIDDPEEHFQTLFSQPRRQQILLGLFARSQFLANALTAYPDFFDWVTRRETLYGARGRAAIERDLADILMWSPSHDDRLAVIRRFRQREILRVGARDICLNVPVKDITRDLADLAEAIISQSLEGRWRETRADKYPHLPIARLKKCFCVAAFGKLGGRELNYSSDIDLLGFYDEAQTAESGIDPAIATAIYAEVMEGLGRDLTERTRDGAVYRVDFRLRPYGASGPIVNSLERLKNYYNQSAALWEIQAALKLRPVAGDKAVGENFIAFLRQAIAKEHDRRRVIDNIKRLRSQSVKRGSMRNLTTIDVKNGVGGIRDIEFLAQGLQLIHAAACPDLITGNTLDALDALRGIGALSEDAQRELSDHYVFLRQVEHYLQILEDTQRHSIPSNPRELRALARRALGAKTSPEKFLNALKQRMERARELYGEYLK